MILTKLWAALLAFLATACLAGMFLLSLRSATGFTDADRKVIRAVTEAGIAAIAADIQSSPVSMGPSLLNDTRLRDALDAAMDERRRNTVDLPGVFAEVANEGMLREYPSMSVAIVDKDANVLARTGLEEPLFDELVESDDFRRAQEDPKDSLFSATLGKRLHTVKVSRRDLTTLERRVIAIQAVDLGGGSSLRRVLGTSYPAGLVRGSAIVGDAIGGAKEDELTMLVSQQIENAPPEGASQVFPVGQGPSARIGAIGRVPGPAGRGPNATVLAVMSMSTAGAGQHDLAAALSQAQADGLLAQLSWLPLGALLVVALTLCFYFPHLENTVPLRRLIAEFDNVGQGRQAQIYQETYNGLFGDLARAAVRTHTVLREEGPDGFDGEYDDALDEYGPATPDAPPVRDPLPPRRKTAGSEPSPKPAPSIELPSVDAGESRLETNAVEPALPAAGPASSARNLAPPLTETNAEDELLADLDRNQAGSASDSKLGGLLGNETSGAKPLPSHPPAHGLGARGQGGSGLRPVGGGGGGLPRFSPPAAAEPERDAYYREVFDQFVQTKKACGENLDGFTFDRFARKLEQNTKTLSKGDASVEVKFTVYVKNGAAALKAKVVKA